MIKDKIRDWVYYILLFLSTVYVFINRYEIYTLNQINAMFILFIVWIVLLLFPLFSEIDIFGLKIKKEIEKTKEEIKSDIKDLRLDIMNIKIANSSSSTVNFSGEFLPSASRLNKIKSEGYEERIIEKTESNKESTSQKSTSTKYYPNGFDVSEDAVYLFKVRSFIEGSLVDICNKLGFTKNYNLREMVRFVKSLDLIKSRQENLLIEAICWTTNCGCF